MTRAFLLLLGLTLAVPVIFADPTVLGVPDITCQTPDEWRTHDYGAPATGVYVVTPQNGNLEECGDTYGLFLLTEEDCQALVDNGVGPGSPAYDLACSTDRPADWDGDLEFAFGGAWLASDTGDGVSSGSLACWGMIGHHPQGGNVQLTDASGLPTAFIMTADRSHPASLLPPGTPDCGDGIVQPCDPTPPEPSSLPQPAGGVVDTTNALAYGLLNEPSLTCNLEDECKPCISACVADFAPGADGTYKVYIGLSEAGNDGLPTGPTAGHISL